MSDVKEHLELEKYLWTHDDFEIMGWHDCLIHAMHIVSDGEKFINELVFDIDYIFKWNDPAPIKKHFTFWIAPCTLVFKHLSNLKMEMGTDDLMPLEFIISGLYNEGQQKKNEEFTTTKWRMELVNGEIIFEATGFEQFVRRKPIHVSVQELSIEQRGGITFERVSWTEKKG